MQWCNGVGCIKPRKVVPGARKRREWCRCGNGATERKKEIQARGRKGCKGVGGSGAVCRNGELGGVQCARDGQRCKVHGRGGVRFREE